MAKARIKQTIEISHAEREGLITMLNASTDIVQRALPVLLELGGTLEVYRWLKGRELCRNFIARLQ